MADLNSDQLAGLAEQYFEGVDNMDWDAVRETLTRTAPLKSEVMESCTPGETRVLSICSRGFLTVIRKSGMEHFAMSVMLKGSLSPLNSRWSIL